MDISKSNFLKSKALSLLPALSQTFSKSPSSFVEGIFPVYADRADGCHIFDVDGNKYVDYLMALGPIVLGYNYKKVNDAIINQLQKGIIFSLPHTTEIEAAEALTRIIPCAEMVRYTKSGSDAVTGVVRAARAITKKDIILYCGSGGVWDDWFSVITNRNFGIPKFNVELIKTFDYNDIEKAEELFRLHKNKVAAVIMEPVILELPKQDFLMKVKKLAEENEALFIFDEILTGFRISRGGGQEYFNVLPDIATFAKGMANGMPLGAIVGKSEYMKIFDDVFVSTTYGGEALSLAACVATIQEFEKYDVCSHMWKIGTMIKEGFNRMAKENELDAECIGLSPRQKLLFRDEQGNDSLLYKSLFLQELVDRGIFMHPNTILTCYSHSIEEVKITLDAIEISLSILKDAINKNEVRKRIRGEVAKEVIRRIV